MSSKDIPAYLNLNFKDGPNNLYIRYKFEYTGETGPYKVDINKLPEANVCVIDGASVCTKYADIAGTDLYEHL